MIIEREIVLIPTHKASSIVKCTDDGIINYLGGDVKSSLDNWTNHHLYVVSNEDIKPGDWYLYNWTNIDEIDLLQCEDQDAADRCNDKSMSIGQISHKVIASSDKSLARYELCEDHEDGVPGGYYYFTDDREIKYITEHMFYMAYGVPTISDTFIEHYIKSPEPILFVDIEYTTKYIEPPSHIHSNRGSDITILKLDGRDIIINFNEQTFTLNDIRKAFQAGARRGYCQRSIMANVGATCEEPDEDTWIKQNLSPTE